MAVTTATTPMAYHTKVLLPAPMGECPPAPPLRRSSVFPLCAADDGDVVVATSPPSSVSAAALVAASSGVSIGGRGGVPSLRTVVISPAFRITQAPARLHTRTKPSNTMTFITP